MELSVNEFNDITNRFCDKYSDKILSLRKTYLDNAKYMTIEKFRKLNRLYRGYISELIYDVINELKKYYEIDFCVILSGSLARHSNTLFSDIDINYLTVKASNNVVIEMEDKINYILQKVLRYRGKDRIHSMVVYLPLASDKKLEFIYQNNYPLRFSDGIIYNQCRDNAEKLMYETYNSTRNLFDIIDYFNQNDTMLKLNEWSYCFECVYNFDLFAVYEGKRRLYRKEVGIKKLIIELIREINSDNKYLNENDTQVINLDLKKIYKTTVLFNFYKVLAIYYRIDHNVKKFNLDDFYKNGTILDKKIFYYFNKYLMIIQNIQYILDMKNIDLSSHSNAVIDIKDLNNMYKEISGRDNVIKDLNKYKNRLYNMCISNLKGVLR